MKKAKKGQTKKAIPIKWILLVIFIIAMCFICAAALNKMDLKNVTKTKYKSTVNTQGKYTYTYEEEQSGYIKEITSEEIAEELEPTLGEYIRKTKEENLEIIKYLIEAETVTKFPYIDREDSEETALNGNIKFYRYIKENEEESEINGEDVKEENRLKFMDLETFNAKKEAFKTNPEENRDIYNYFTIDEEGSVVIAYGSEENRNIQNGAEGTLIDRDLSLDIINANSSEIYSGDNDTGYTAIRYEIETKTIDYLSLVEQYVIPTNLLYSLLIHTGDIDFVVEIARLAYESEIAIGIFDNKTHYERSETYTYYKMLEVKANTSLDFKDPIVSITNMGRPEIKLTNENLRSSIYQGIIFSCETTTFEDGKIWHKEIKKDGESTSHSVDDYNMYITGTDSNNKITSLGKKDLATYKLHYTQIRDSMTMPTIGVLVADTWISRWEATYTKYNPNPTSTSTEDVTLEERVDIQEYANSNEVLNSFGPTLKSNAEEKLRDHATNVIDAAIEIIKNNTPEQTFNVTISSISVTQAESRKILNDHMNDCHICVSLRTATLRAADIEERTVDIYTEVTSTSGSLHNTDAYAHYESALKQYKQEKVIEKANERRNEFEKQLEKIKDNSVSQTLNGTKYYKDIISNSTTTTKTTRYEKTNTETDRVKEKDGEKFSKIFNSSNFYDSREAIKKRSGQLWDYIRENEDTAKLEDILRYLLNKATNSEMFGKIDDIDEILNAFEPKMQKFGMVSGAVSPFGTNMGREDFIAAAQSAHKNKEYYQRNLASIAGEFYDICAQFNVNPAIAYAWACVETGYGNDKSIPDNNLFGMAVYNGANSGTKYSTKEDSIEDFCQWVIKNSTSSETYNQAEEYATVNSIFEGSPENNIYALFCRYMYLGKTHISDEPDFNNPKGEEYYKSKGSNWGSGGRIYIYHMYELGGLYENQYAERCGHSNGSDETTLQEKADYVHYSIKKRIKIATDIFGTQVFIGGDGTYQKSDNNEIRGYYTSSSGKKYTEWIQSKNVGCGSEIIKAKPSWGIMGSVGCPLYASAILSGAEGIEITPRIVNNKYFTGSVGTTLQAICKAYNIPKTVKEVKTKASYIAILKGGYGVATYVNSRSGFAVTKHWIVVADIRTTELGSSEGYDVYILSSTTKGLTETRWHPIEKVINNLEYGYQSYGWYFSD